jgi:hypothetical protein
MTTISASFNKARDEVKKAFKEKKLSPSFANAFITLIITIFFQVKVIFFRMYNFIFTKLNYILPLPFSSHILKEPMKKTKKNSNPKDKNFKRKKRQG